jgi:hypothetical protein
VAVRLLTARSLSAVSSSHRPRSKGERGEAAHYPSSPSSTLLLLYHCSHSLVRHLTAHSSRPARWRTMPTAAPCGSSTLSLAYHPLTGAPLSVSPGVHKILCALQDPALFKMLMPVSLQEDQEWVQFTESWTESFTREQELMPWLNKMLTVMWPFLNEIIAQVTFHRLTSSNRGIALRAHPPQLRKGHPTLPVALRGASGV